MATAIVLRFPKKKIFRSLGDRKRLQDTYKTVVRDYPKDTPAENWRWALIGLDVAKRLEERQRVKEKYGRRTRPPRTNADGEA